MSHTLTASLKQALLSLGFLIAFTGVVVVLLLAAFEDMQHFSLKEEIKMKKIISTLWLVVSCILLCACQKTPEAPVIIVGDDSKYLEPASQGGNPLADDLPERYEGIIDVGNKNVKIKIDASVIAAQIGKGNSILPKQI